MVTCFGITGKYVISQGRILSGIPAFRCLYIRDDNAETDVSDVSGRIFMKRTLYIMGFTDITLMDVSNPKEPARVSVIE
jgi:hypothetical protein